MSERCGVCGREFHTEQQRDAHVGRKHATALNEFGVDS